MGGPGSGRRPGGGKSKYSPTAMKVKALKKQANKKAQLLKEKEAVRKTKAYSAKMKIKALKAKVAKSKSK